jgi:hypothetical protein
MGYDICTPHIQPQFQVEGENLKLGRNFTRYNPPPQKKKKPTPKKKLIFKRGSWVLLCKAC